MIPPGFEPGTHGLAYHYSFHYPLGLWSGLFHNRIISDLGDPCIVSMHFLFRVWHVVGIFISKLSFRRLGDLLHSQFPEMHSFCNYILNIIYSLKAVAAIQLSYGTIIIKINFLCVGTRSGIRTRTAVWPKNFKFLSSTIPSSEHSNNNLYVGSTSYEKHRRLGPNNSFYYLKTDFQYYTFVYISSNQATLY